jgi:hypothetical protein
VTEMGYPADPAYQWESGYQNGAASQTAYDRQAIVSLLDAGAATVFVTERDMPSGNGAFSSEGVIGRPAFQMVQQLAAGS